MTGLAMLEFLGMASDAAASSDLVGRLGGVAYVNHPAESDKRPYSGLFRIATDNVEAVAEVADVALHVCFPRVIKPLVTNPPDRVIATFGMVRNPAMTHRESDDHWRDNHGPLALRSHSAMSDYTQLSIVATLSGKPLDGVAMCAFATRDDMRHRFFDDDAAKAAIEVDVATFANPMGSPRRVVLEQQP